MVAEGELTLKDRRRSISIPYRDQRRPLKLPGEDDGYMRADGVPKDTTLSISMRHKVNE